METKRCPICLQTKNITEYYSYYSKSRAKNRISNYCKPCGKSSSLIRAKRHYQNNIEEKKIYAKAYQANPENREKVKRWRTDAKIRHRKNLQNCYVRELLRTRNNLTNADIESIPEIVETKRLQVKIKRKLKSLRNGKE
ncbi:hypothetical protein [Dysgonomonas macrotermitis]|uniref:Uncharacterized protein n=1 Tax=Dysgonomonas macrotermitis TaxID=1346286 RepID=A0A1M4UN28_9BACT|nr:hypothetical protein [Dysgonomonas macrotermitis]SHE58057.1 hypothetical protein SAMN05444362_101650 [Dysgonomonas macrotermitis]